MGAVFWALRSLNRYISSFFCELSQFAAVIALCGSLLQREQQPELCSIWR